MCGASDQTQRISDSQEQFYKQLSDQDAITFGQNQEILKQMQSVYAPILAAGPSQKGFTQEETDNLNTQAKEGVATSYANAATAMRENNAARGGGNSYLPSGVESQQEAALANASAEQEATEKQQIVEADYDQGRKNFSDATSALLGTNAQNNSVSYANAATGAGSAASDTSTKIDQENSSWYAPLMGAIGGVGAAATGKYFK